MRRASAAPRSCWRAADSCEVKPVGKLDAGNRHVQFDERGGETERICGTAPLLDSTRIRCIRARILRESCCKNGFSQTREAPRCRQSVTRNCSTFHVWKAAKW